MRNSYRNSKLGLAAAGVAAAMLISCYHAEEPFDPSISEAYCRWLERCEPMALNNYTGGDLKGCFEAQACYGEYWLPDPHWESSECAAAFEDADCSTPFLSITDNCLALFMEDAHEDYLSKGEGCDFEGLPICKPGLVCLRESTESSSDGTCQEKLAPGEPCEKPDSLDGIRYNPCAYESFCHSKTHRCIVPKKTGDPCVAGPHECRRGYCGPEGLCVDPGQVGDPCDPTKATDCDSGLECIGETCRTRPDEGEPCEDYCRFGEHCVARVCSAFVCDESKHLGQSQSQAGELSGL